MEYTLILFIILWISVMVAIVFQERIVKYFHLTDARRFLSGRENYQKLNALLRSGNVSLYSHEFRDGHFSVSLSISYSIRKNESVSNCFVATTLDKAVEQAYAWSKKIGFIRE